MWSHGWVPYILTFLSGTSILSNYSSFRYIKTTFNTSDNLFNILVKDALLATLCALLQFTTDFMFLTGAEFLHNKLWCSLSQYGLLLGVTIGPLTSLLISARRIIELRYPKRINISSKYFNSFTTIIMALHVIYVLAFMVTDVVADLNQFGFVSICMGTTILNPDKVNVIGISR